MNFKIDDKIFEKFPGLTIGVVIGKNLDNAKTYEELQKKMREHEKAIRKKYTIETLSQLPKIEVWRKAYTLFGAKPKEHKSSVENLYRLVLRGVELKHINTLVDCYNVISLKHMVPVGGEDMDTIKGNAVLTFATTNEPSVLLLGDKDPRSPHAGEVIYKDDISAICRRWNWREAERTKLTPETKSCILVIEGLLPVTKQDVEEATEELHDLVKRLCGGEVTYTILDEQQSEIEV